MRRVPASYLRFELQQQRYPDPRVDLALHRTAKEFDDYGILSCFAVLAYDHMIKDFVFASRISHL